MTDKQDIQRWEVLITRFWQDFSIPTQEEDSTVNFANPSDITRSLIKARNWIGTVSEHLIAIDKALLVEQKTFNMADRQMRDLVTGILARGFPLSGTSVKNKETQDAFVLSNSSEEEIQAANSLKTTLHNQQDRIDYLKQMKNSFEIMKRAVEKSTDWLIQYLNWHKFEIREKV